MFWFVVIDIALGLLICGLAFLSYMQAGAIEKLKAAVKKLIGEKPKNWNKTVKSEWGLDDER